MSTDTNFSSYEITFITKEDLKEPIVEKTIEALEGRVLSENKLGMKNFVYPIRKEKSGFYTSLVFEIDPLKVTDLNRKLLLEEEVLRFLIVSINVNKEMAEIPETELKPEEVTGKPEDTTAIIEPEQEIEVAPVTEIVAEEPEAKAEPEAEEPKVETKEKTKKAAKETEKPVKATKKVTEKKEKPVKKADVKEETETEEERLEALDKKLEELLKD